MNKRKLRALFNRLVGPLGFELVRNNQYVSNATDRHELLRLIEKLKPVAITTPLVRLGPNGDGGYLVPDDLDGVSSCFSPGVSDISGFELNCADRNIDVFLADNSVEDTPDSHPKFDFIKKFIGAFATEDYITIDQWVSDSSAKVDGEAILQMDIEGFEYETILSMSGEVQSMFRIVVIEFHFLNELWHPTFFKLASRAFEKLLSTHSCVHIHPNNYAEAYVREGISIPPLMEFTFLRNDRVENDGRRLTFPHTLDYDNTDKSELVLPKCWQKI